MGSSFEDLVATKPTMKTDFQSDWLLESYFYILIIKGNLNDAIHYITACTLESRCTRWTSMRRRPVVQFFIVWFPRHEPAIILAECICCAIDKNIILPACLSHHVGLSIWSHLCWWLMSCLFYDLSWGHQNGWEEGSETDGITSETIGTRGLYPGSGPLISNSATSCIVVLPMKC